MFKEEIMKRLLALSIVLLTVAGAAFAQFPDGIKFGGWGRADFVPVQGQYRIDADDKTDFDQAKSGLGSGWSPYSRAELRIVADFQTVGTRFWINSDNFSGNAWGIGDYADIWVKPLGNDLLKVDLGKFLDETLRGKVATDSNFALFAGVGKSGDPIFQRFNGYGGLIQSSPVKGLYIGVMAKPLGGLNGSNGVVASAANATWTPATPIMTAAATVPPGAPAGTVPGPAILQGNTSDATNIWKGVQAAIGYTIPNIGLARIQYVGNAGWDGKHPLWVLANTFVAPGYSPLIPVLQASRIEAAFQYTGVKGLNIDLGTKIYLPVKDTDAKFTYQNNNEINLGVNYTLNDLGILAAFYTGFGGGAKPDSGKTGKTENGFNFQAILEPSYFLSAIDATLGANINIHAVGPTLYEEKDQKDDTAQFAFGLWIRRAFARGSIKTGAAFVLPASQHGKTKLSAGYPLAGQGGYITVPVILEFAF
jgi:hypothetical protein